MRKTTRKEKVRLTLDFPADIHTMVKISAAKEGVSMLTYILDSVVNKIEREEKTDLDVNTFRKELSKITKKDDELMKDLSDR